MRTTFHPQNWPIAIKLLIAFLVVAITPVVLVGFVSQSQARDGLLTEARRNLENTAARTSALIDEFVKTSVTDVQQTATQDPIIRFANRAVNERDTLSPSNPDQLATYNVLKSKAASQGSDQAYLAIATNTGTVEITSNTAADHEGQAPEDEPRDLSGETYFKEALKGQTYITSPRITNFGPGAVKSVFYISNPVRDVRGVPIAVLVERFSLQPVWQIVNNDAEAGGKGSYTMLVDDTDRLGLRIADSRVAEHSNQDTGYLFSVVRTMAADKADAMSKSGRFPANFDMKQVDKKSNLISNLETVLNSPDPDKKNRFFSTSYNDGSAEIKGQAAYAAITARPGWYYFVITPESTYSLAANNITTTVIIAILFASAIVFLLALVAARALTNPIRRIAGILKRIDEGDYAARVPVHGQDELGRLSTSLNGVFNNTLSLIQSREEKDRLQGQIMRLLEEISTVAEGDLTVQAEVNADITGAIADSFNLMIEELRKIILNIQASTGEASSYFDRMVENFGQLDQVSERQASRVQTVSRSAASMNNSIQQVSEAATLSAEVAQNARENARHGGRAVSQTIAGMNRIRSNVQDTAKKIKRLGESSVQIGEIVKLIDGIADQTNMLALNAAIQAAMAGEQGKGFSVVAEEVRRLAERSARATREIAALVKSIQDDTSEAVIAMEESTLEVVDGSKIADEAGRALSAIESVVERLATLITNISVVSRQQAGSSSEIAGSMQEIAVLTQEATALRLHSAEAVQVVAHSNEELRVSVSAFKVQESGTPAARPQPAEALAAASAPLSSDYRAFQLAASASSNFIEAAGSHSYPENGLNGSSNFPDGGIINLNSFLDDDSLFEPAFDSGSTLRSNWTSSDAPDRRPSSIG